MKFAADDDPHLGYQPKKVQDNELPIGIMLVGCLFSLSRGIEIDPDLISNSIFINARRSGFFSKIIHKPKWFPIATSGKSHWLTAMNVDRWESLDIFRLLRALAREPRSEIWELS
jgi:hypothetical protein